MTAVAVPQAQARVTLSLRPVIAVPGVTLQFTGRAPAGRTVQVQSWNGKRWTPAGAAVKANRRGTFGVPVGFMPGATGSTTYRAAARVGSTSAISAPLTVRLPQGPSWVPMKTQRNIPVGKVVNGTPVTVRFVANAAVTAFDNHDRNLRVVFQSSRDGGRSWGEFGMWWGDVPLTEVVKPYNPKTGLATFRVRGVPTRGTLMRVALTTSTAPGGIDKSIASTVGFHPVDPLPQTNPGFPVRAHRSGAGLELTGVAVRNALDIGNDRGADLRHWDVRFWQILDSADPAQRTPVTFAASGTASWWYDLNTGEARVTVSSARMVDPTRTYLMEVVDDTGKTLVESAPFAVPATTSFSSTPELLGDSGAS